MACLSCQPQKIIQNNEISFEDVQHTSFALHSQRFLVVDTQEKMDAIFQIIHQHNPGDRFPPIPTINNEETYLVINSEPKNTDDVVVKKIINNDGNLIIDIEDFSNPNTSDQNEKTVSILIKFLKKVNVKNVTITHQ